MSNLRTEARPIAVFRATLVSAVSDLLERKPLGFAVEDIEREMSGATTTAMKRRIRHQLERMTEIGQLDRVERGLYIAGEHSLAIEESDIARAVSVAFRDAGGVIAMDDLLANLPHALSNRRNVLAYLAASDDYQTCLPIRGMTRHWLLRSDLRHRVPLSGEHQLLELRMLRMSKGAVPTGWGLGALQALRRRIAQGLEDARALREMDVATLLADPKLRRALSDRIAAVAEAEEPDEETAKLVAGQAGNGSGSLLDAFWEDLEAGNSLACFQRILDVRCWDAIGAALDLDPAALSRGALMRSSSLSK